MLIRPKKQVENEVSLFLLFKHKEVQRLRALIECSLINSHAKHLIIKHTFAWKVVIIYNDCSKYEIGVKIVMNKL